MASALVLDYGSTEVTCAVRKTDLRRCLALGDMRQALVSEYETSQHAPFVGRFIGQVQLIPEICGRRFGGSSEVVLNVRLNDHLGRQPDRVRSMPVPRPEDVPDVAELDSRASYPESSLHQRVIRQQGEKSNRVEEVRLPHAIRPRHARERPEIQLEPEQILEPVNFEPRQHIRILGHFTAPGWRATSVGGRMCGAPIRPRRLIRAVICPIRAAESKFERPFANGADRSSSEP